MNPSIGKIRYFTRKLSYKSPHIQETLKKNIESFKIKTKWRPTMSERSDVWESKLKAFSNDDQTSDFITMMQQPIDMSPSGIKKWWSRRQERHDRFMQSYIPQRHSILGSDLAAAHFIVHRGGSIKFLNIPKWVKADEDNQYVLPSLYDAKYLVEAIKCDGMKLYYEGLENIRRLQHLKFWSFRNVKTFDDWCLDRITGAQNPNLEILDLSGTCITEHGLTSLYRLENLKVLVLDVPKESTSFELVCAMLEENRPKLKICSSESIHQTMSED